MEAENEEILYGYHRPVMLEECIHALDIQPDGVYVDLTFGGGGHSRAILQRLSSKGRLIAFDQDADAAANALDDARFELLPYNFRFLTNGLRLAGVEKVDGILADLGVSSFQFDTAERGFSYRFDAPLDMRMSQSGTRTAADILRTYNAEELQNMFSSLGELRNARTLAQAIVQARQRKAISTTQEFLALLERLVMGKKFRYLGQVFQALRMEVNEEIAALQEMLQQTTKALRAGGRLAVITFHSIEDRLVKNWIKNGNFMAEPARDFYGNAHTPFTAATKKPIEPTQEESRLNSRAHSARLRVGLRND